MKLCCLDRQIRKEKADFTPKSLSPLRSVCPSSTTDVNLKAYKAACPLSFRTSFIEITQPVLAVTQRIKQSLKTDVAGLGLSNLPSLQCLLYSNTQASISTSTPLLPLGGIYLWD